MEIQIIKPNTAKYYFENNQHVLNFGDIPHRAKAIVDYKLVGDKLTNISVLATCGCTASEIDQNGQGIIEYKSTNSRGAFAKTLKVSYKSAGKEVKTQIKIKGNII